MGDWTEKYRPKSLDEVVGNDKAIIELRKWAGSWDNNIPKYRAVVLSGKPGIGKTSCAIACANDFGWTYIELNTSDARNALKIKTVATYGAINETFSNDGSFKSTLKGERKLIILDEADNLYDRVNGPTELTRDLSDRGGKKAIIETVKRTNQPIILIVNDYYNLIKGGGEALKNLCKLIRFYNPYSSSVFNLLKKICINEDISIDTLVLKSISDRCKGDIRSAINDLESICANRSNVDMKSLSVLGYRDREKDIFTALREIFKTKNIQAIKETVTHLDTDPDLLILWLNENLPREYIDTNDLLKGYEALSLGDVFLGRTRKKQNYGLWSYACDIMNGGIAVAKTRNYPNDSYSFPVWLRERKDIRTKYNTKEIIIKKIADKCHISNNKTRDFILQYFISLFKNDINFAIEMKNLHDFSDEEVEYLLGKNHAHKFKEIIAATEHKKIQPIIQEKEKNMKEEKEKVQQSLFDF